jgi:L-ascorbate metabolism protein UlaG (beta-lactamase superfamily)
MLTLVTGVIQIKRKYNRMKVTYYGHSSFAAEINGKHLLFDPFIVLARLSDGKVQSSFQRSRTGNQDID